MADKPVGKVTHYYDKISVAVLDLTSTIKTGDTLKFVKGDDQFDQKVESMQVEHKNVDTAKKGDSIGLKVNQPVKPQTQVFLVQ